MSKAVRRQAPCADCLTVKEIRAHGLCATCYSRRTRACYRWDGPPPTMRLWGFGGPCVDCAEHAVGHYRRQRCRRCYERLMARTRAQEFWRTANAYLEDKTADEIDTWLLCNSPTRDQTHHGRTRRRAPTAP